MAFKMKGNVDFGHGTGSSRIKKSQQDIDASAAEEVAMDSGALPRTSTFKQSEEVAMDSGVDAVSNVPGSGGIFSTMIKGLKNIKEKIPGMTDTSPEEGESNEPTTRNEAFAAARKAGKPTFTWEGKEYHTRRADETKEEWQKKFNTDLPSPGKTPGTKKETPATTEEPPVEEAKSAAGRKASPEVDRPDYQKRRQERRIARRRSKGGRDAEYDIRTDKKEARMKYGRGSEEFKKYKQELKDAKAARRQERRDNR